MEKGALVGIGRTAEIFEWGKDKVLKLYMDWCSETWIGHEEEITSLCYKAGLPAPQTFGLTDIDGRKGLIMERLDGITMMQDIDLKFTSDPASFLLHAPVMAEVHASLHSKALPGLPHQYDMIRGGIERAESLPDDLRKKVLDRLDKLPNGDVVCHYDLHPGNIMLTSKGPVLIDWLTASCGNPHADIARTLLLIGHGGPPEEVMSKVEFDKLRSQFIVSYLAEYSKFQELDPKQLDAWRVPVAAARLNENIKEQEDWLLGIVENGLDSSI